MNKYYTKIKLFFAKKHTKQETIIELLNRRDIMSIDKIRAFTGDREDVSVSVVEDFAFRCALEVKHLMKDERSITALLKLLNRGKWDEPTVTNCLTLATKAAAAMRKDKTAYLHQVAAAEAAECACWVTVGANPPFKAASLSAWALRVSVSGKRASELAWQMAFDKQVEIAIELLYAYEQKYI
jgi:hypothetical protein